MGNRKRFFEKPNKITMENNNNLFLSVEEAKKLSAEGLAGETFMKWARIVDGKPWAPTRYGKWFLTKGGVAHVETAYVEYIPTLSIGELLSLLPAEIEIDGHRSFLRIEMADQYICYWHEEYPDGLQIKDIVMPFGEKTPIVNAAAQMLMQVKAYLPNIQQCKKSKLRSITKI